MWRLLARRSTWLTAVVILVVIAVLWAIETPSMANAFGYALPGQKGLPYRVHYGHRYYNSELTCAGADWCAVQVPPLERGKPFCTAGAEVRKHLAERGRGPLVRVGEMVTLFGPSHGMFVDSGGAPNPPPAALLYVEADQDDCYVEYGMVGGP